jgi:hypothetical protein
MSPVLPQAERRGEGREQASNEKSAAWQGRPKGNAELGARRRDDRGKVPDGATLWALRDRPMTLRHHIGVIFTS